MSQVRRGMFGGGGGSGGGRRQPIAKAPKIDNVRSVLARLWSYVRSRRVILLVVFFLALLTTAVTIVGTRINGYAVDRFILEGDLYGLAILCVILTGIYVLGVGSMYAQNALMVRASQRTAADIRQDLFAQMQSLPLGYYDTHSSGDLMSRLTNDVDNINQALSQNLVQLFTSMVTIVGMLIAMVLLSPLLTALCLVTMPVTFLVSRILLRFSQRFYAAQQRELGQLNGVIEEMVSGQKVVRLFGKEAAVQRSFNGINDTYATANFKAVAVSGVVGPLNNFVNNFAYILVAAAGGAAVILDYGSVTVGVVFAFLLYMRNFTNPINNILNLINTLQLSLASAERVFAILDEPRELDRPDAANISDIKGDIIMDIGSFAYEPGKEILNGAHIVAKPGQTVAIVGPTGSGKTTLINLLTRFYDLDDGTILVDGRDIRTITRHSLRQSIAVVLQDTFLFSDTIRENIRLGRPGASDGDVEEAARKARAHEFISILPLGYDTVLVDNGQNISQGQRQLLGIARAIIADAPVLILDEATSSIDTRTEMLIQQALRELTRGRTTFVIAHRLSTIKNADRILVINHGRVAESGTHEELLAKKGFYWELYTSQFKGFTI